MKYVFLIPLTFLGFASYAQTDATFNVKKKVNDDKERLHVFKYDFFDDIDTIEGQVLYVAKTAAVDGLYDSISTTNLKYMKVGGKRMGIYSTCKSDCYAILRLYKKQEDGTFKMIYIHNFIVAGLKTK